MKFKIATLLLVLSATLFAKEVDIKTLPTLNRVLAHPIFKILDALDKGEFYLIKLNAFSRRGSKIVYAYLDKSSNIIYIRGRGYYKDGKPIELPKNSNNMAHFGHPALKFSQIDKGEFDLIQLNIGNNSIYSFLDKSSQVLYIGNEAYDKNGELITFPKDKKVIDNGVFFSYGTGDKELYLVTDPQCPYCSKFEKASEGKLKDYKINLIFLPLRFHKDAPAMIEWIMQGKDAKEQKERLTKVMVEKSQEYKKLIPQKGKFNYSSNVALMVAKGMKAVTELDAKGTPSLYDSNFNKVNWRELFNSIKTPKAKK